MTWPSALLPFVRTSSVATVGGFRPPESPSTSWIGKVQVAAPNETWPVCDGRALSPIIQVRVDELVAPLPGPLENAALLALFLDLDDIPTDRPNGHGWELRLYDSLDGLVELVEPASSSRPQEAPRPFPLRWAAREEVPTHDEAPDELLDLYEDDDEWDVGGTKVGGWAHTVQSEVCWVAQGARVLDAQLVLQIDWDEKAQLMLGDAGTGYVGWSPTAGWLFEWQCY